MKVKVVSRRDTNTGNLPVLSWVIVCLVLAVVALSCGPVRLVSLYDELTDKTITTLQHRMAEHLLKLEKAGGSAGLPYAGCMAFYDSLRVDISGLSVRASAVPKNRITIQQLSLLDSTIRTIDSLHQVGIDKQHIPLIRDSFDASCRAILTFELAKRDGRKTEE